MELFTIILNVCFWLCVAGAFSLVLWIALCWKKDRRQAVPRDPHFERFYLDLLAKTAGVDFTREEAQRLYVYLLWRFFTDEGDKFGTNREEDIQGATTSLYVDSIFKG